MAFDGITFTFAINASPIYIQATSTLTGGQFVTRVNSCTGGTIITGCEITINFNYTNNNGSFAGEVATISQGGYFTTFVSEGSLPALTITITSISVSTTACSGKYRYVFCNL